MITKYTPETKIYAYSSGDTAGFTDYIEMYGHPYVPGEWLFGYRDILYGTTLNFNAYTSTDVFSDDFSKRRITKVEIGLTFSVSDTSLKVYIKPVFNGTSGVSKQLTSGTSFSTQFYNITCTTNSPFYNDLEWTSTNLQNTGMGITIQNTSGPTSTKVISIRNILVRVTYCSNAFRVGQNTYGYYTGAVDLTLGGDSTWVTPENAFDFYSASYATATRSAIGSSYRLVGQTHSGDKYDGIPICMYTGFDIKTSLATTDVGIGYKKINVNPVYTYYQTLYANTMVTAYQWIDDDSLLNWYQIKNLDLAIFLITSTVTTRILYVEDMFLKVWYIYPTSLIIGSG